MNSHPQRSLLHNELHARPRPPLAAPHRISMIALLRSKAAADDSLAPLRALCRDYRIAEPSAEQSHFFGDFGSYRLKWERHGEFDDYTVYRAGADPANPFAQPAIDALPQGWVDSLPGECIAAAHVTLLGEASDESQRMPAPMAFDSDRLVGAAIGDSPTRVFTDLQLDAQGFSRFLFLDVAMSATHAGREVQRLLDIDMYRMMAMLAFPIARETAGELEAFVDDVRSGSEDDGALLDDRDGNRLGIRQCAAATSEALVAHGEGEGIGAKVAGGVPIGHVGHRGVDIRQ